MCVDCVLASPRIAQVDPGDGPPPEVVLSQVGTRRRDLLEHGAHVLGVACYERPPHVVRRTLEVTHSGQALAPRYVALILNRE
jgi:hypothetical protein